MMIGATICGSNSGPYILVAAQTLGDSLRQRRHFLVNVLFHVGLGQHVAGDASCHQAKARRRFGTAETIEHVAKQRPHSLPGRESRGESRRASVSDSRVVLLQAFQISALLTFQSVVKRALANPHRFEQVAQRCAGVAGFPEKPRCLITRGFV